MRIKKNESMIGINDMNLNRFIHE